MKPKRHIFESTMNVRTLRCKNKMLEVCLFNQFSLYILGVVDHKIVHDDEEIVYYNLNKITTSAWRNSNNAAAGSVGILISEIGKKFLAHVRTINES